MAHATLVLCSCPVAGQAALPVTVIGSPANLQAIVCSGSWTDPLSHLCSRWKSPLSLNLPPAIPYTVVCPLGPQPFHSCFQLLSPGPPENGSLFSRPILPTFRCELGIITGWRPVQVLAQGTPLTPGSLALALQQLSAACAPQRHVRVPLSKSLVVLRASTRPYHPAQQAQVPLRSLFQLWGPTVLSTRGWRCGHSDLVPPARAQPRGSFSLGCSLKPPGLLGIVAGTQDRLWDGKPCRSSFPHVPVDMCVLHKGPSWGHFYPTPCLVVSSGKMEPECTPSPKAV